MSNEIAVIEKQSAKVVERAKAIVVADQKTYDVANAFISTIKGVQKEVKATFEPIIKKAHAAHKEAVAQKDRHLKPLEQAEKFVKEKTVAYYTEQERKRREEERKAQEKADREAQKEKDRLEARAKKAEENGDTTKAETLRDKAEEVEPVDLFVAPKVEQSAGVSYREKWTAIVIDKKTVPDEWKTINQSALDRHAQNTKGQIAIPGVKFKVEKIQANR